MTVRKLGESEGFGEPLEAETLIRGKFSDSEIIPDYGDIIVTCSHAGGKRRANTALILYKNRPISFIFATLSTH